MTTETQTTAAATTTEGAASQQVDQTAAQNLLDEGQTATAASTTQQQATAEQTEPSAEAKDSAQTGDDKGKPEGAPETYEFKTPDGHEFDTQVIEQFSQVVKELDMPQVAAQKILDKVLPVMQARQAEVVQALHTEWKTNAQADKEFGGDKLKENLAVANKALNTLGTPELRTLLNQSGLANHPEVLRLLYRTGKAMSEDTFVGGKPTPAKPPSPAQRMYPNMNP